MEKNLKLKAAIVQKYGSQASFSAVIGKSPVFISQVITGAAFLSEIERRLWAKMLGRDEKELFEKANSLNAIDRQLWEQCEAEWSNDPALRNEFCDRFETYFYFKSAEGTGLCRQTKGRSK